MQAAVATAFVFDGTVIVKLIKLFDFNYKAIVVNDKKECRVYFFFLIRDRENARCFVSKKEQVLPSLLIFCPFSFFFLFCF